MSFAQAASGFWRRRSEVAAPPSPDGAKDVKQAPPRIRVIRPEKHRDGALIRLVAGDVGTLKVEGEDAERARWFLNGHDLGIRGDRLSIVMDGRGEIAPGHYHAEIGDVATTTQTDHVRVVQRSASLWVKAKALFNRERVTLPLVGLVAGLPPAVLFAASKGWDEFGHRFGVVGMLGLGSMLSAAVLGFLFGIPRLDAATRDKLKKIRDRPEDHAVEEDHPLEYVPNTNLEQVSDWLTKILVGVGLTQLGAIGDALGDLVAAGGAALGGQAGDSVFAGGLMIYCATIGFLAGYISTTLFLYARIVEEVSRTRPSNS